MAILAIYLYRNRIKLIYLQSMLAAYAVKPQDHLRVADPAKAITSLAGFSFLSEGTCAAE